MGAQRAAAAALSGGLPPIADFYFPRTETGFGLTDAVRPGETIILARKGLPGDDQPTEGVGKTQLAVAFAHAALNSSALDVLVWVPAGSRESIVASYAQAAGELDGDRPGEIADAAAQRFLGWLSRTQLRWALILDDLADVADLNAYCPRGATGQVLVTTRIPEGELQAADRTVVGVVPFSRREALGYLNSRLTDHPDQRIESLDLAEDLAGLPVSLAQAAAIILESDSTARDFRASYADRRLAITGSPIDGCPPSMLPTWSLAVERANELAPADHAWPALALAAVLSTDGIPAAVLTSPAACSYITGRPSDANVTDQGQVRAAYGNLARLGLVSLDRASGVRTVWMHSAVRAAARAYLPRADVEHVVASAASAVLEAWPEPGSGAEPKAAQMEQALRSCTDSLRAFAGDLLWKPDAHPLLLRAGLSLGDGLLANDAIDYWASIASACGHLLGPGHEQSVIARDKLAASYALAGRTGEAMSVFEAALADRERNLGADHPETLAARVSLAHSYDAAGLTAQAIALYEQARADCDRLLGPADPDSLAVMASLAKAYQAAGRQGDSIRLLERAVTEAEQALGPAHRETLDALAALGNAYQAAGLHTEAIAAYQHALQEQERAMGADHRETIAIRAQVASAYRQAGRHKEAIQLSERVLADRTRGQGKDHPDTIAARSELAHAYRSARKLKDAIPQFERVLADRERVLGPDHRDTLSARSDLAAAHQEVRGAQWR